MTSIHPKDYIPFKISTCTDEIEIPPSTNDQEILEDYRLSADPDVIVIFNSKKWPLHVIALEQYSDIFWKGLAKKVGDMYYFDTKQSGNQLQFEKIISYIYGNKVTIKRSEVQQFYRLTKIMYLPDLKDLLQNDMIDYFDDYDIFPLLKFATEQKILNVTAFCYETLEIEHFQPLRYNKSGLFLCQPELFRTIIKRHNFMKKEYNGVKFGLGDFEIQKLIEEYSFVNGIKGRRKEKFLEDVENKQNCNYFFISKPNIDLFSTHRKINTLINLPSLTSLANIRQPEEQESPQKLSDNKKTKLQQCVSFVNDSISLENDKKQSGSSSPMSPKRVKKQHSTDQISLLNFSPTYRKKRQNSPSKRSNKQFNPISDLETMMAISTLSQNLKDSLKSSTQTQKKASQMTASLKLSVKRSKNRTCRIKQMEGQLDQLYALILSSQTKIEEIQKTVTTIEQRQKQAAKVKKSKKNNFIQTSIALDLSLSKQFANSSLKSPQLSKI